MKIVNQINEARTDVIKHSVFLHEKLNLLWRKIKRGDDRLWNRRLIIQLQNSFSGFWYLSPPPPSPPLPPLHTWTLHPGRWAIKDKECSQCCEEFGQVFGPLVKLHCGVKHAGDMKNTRSEEDFYFGGGEEWWNLHLSSSPAPPSSHAYMATMMGWVGGGGAWLAPHFSQGIILANGRRGWAGLLYSPALHWTTSLSAFPLTSWWSVPIILLVLVIHTELQQQEEEEKEESPVGINYSY